MPSKFNPKISILIPVYNGANYMCEAIDSALAQTYKNIEVIVVNDGSTDDGESDAISKAYGDKIRYFSKVNGGVSSALNLGIKKMTGDYFSWLSHDDLYCQNKISSQIDYLRHSVNKEIILFCDIKFIDANGKFINSLAIDEVYLNNPILLILSTYLHGCSLLIPKTAFRKFGMFNETLQCVQDVEMWLRLAMAGFQFTYLPKVMVQSRVHPQQTTWTLKDHHAKEKRDYNLWAIDSIDKQTLRAYHEEIFKILFKKNQPDAIDRLLNIMQTTNNKNGMQLMFTKGALVVLRLKNYFIAKFPSISAYMTFRKFTKIIRISS